MKMPDKKEPKKDQEKGQGHLSKDFVKEKEKQHQHLGQVMKDLPLFGDDDQIINTLTLEQNEVGDLLKKTLTAIENKKVESETLRSRYSNLGKAIKTIQERHVDETKEKTETNGKKEKVK